MNSEPDPCQIFDFLRSVYARPAPFEFYTTDSLWTDDYRSERMLSYHLNPDVDAATWNHSLVERAVAWIGARFGVRDGCRIADFGCGPGLYTTRLARLGGKVSGIDFSHRSIAYARETARREGLEIAYYNESYLDFSPEGPFDLVTMIMCDFGAMGPDRRGRLLERFRSVLAPGGAVLLDVNSLKTFERRQECRTCGTNLLDGFWAPGEYYGFLNVFKYEREKVILDKYSIVEKEKRYDVYNWLQCYDPESLRDEFSAHGFVIEECHGNIAGAPYDPEGESFAVVARVRS